MPINFLKQAIGVNRMLGMYRKLAEKWVFGIVVNRWFVRKFIGILLARRPKNGRNEIGKALAHPGARLDCLMLPLEKGVVDRLSHIKLLLAKFVVLQSPGNGSVRTENVKGRYSHNELVSGEVKF